MEVTASCSASKTNVEVRRMPPGHHLIDQSCRVCMGTIGKMNSLFKEKKRIVHPICDKITFCTGIHITKGDGLPSKICNQCLKDLKVAYKFKMSCIRTEETFKLIKESNIKSETVETSYENDCCETEDYIDESLFENSFIEASDDVKIDIKLEIGNATTVKMKREKGNFKTMNKVRSISRKSVAKYPRKETKTKDKVIDVKLKSNLRGRRCKVECETCNVTFQTKALYAAHNRTVHEKKSFMCEICGKVFRHQSSQSAHKLTHQEPRYHCHNCDYRTFYKQDLVTHMRVHTGAKNYICSQCPLTFSTSSNRLAHVRRAHVKMNRFTCHVCGRGFVEKFELGRHLDTHQDVKRHVCEVCEGRFSRRSHLKRHLFRQHNVSIASERCGRRRQYASKQANNLESTNETLSSNINTSRSTQESIISPLNAVTSEAYSVLTSQAHSVLTSQAHSVLTSQAHSVLTSQANSVHTSHAHSLTSHANTVPTSHPDTVLTSQAHTLLTSHAHMAQTLNVLTTAPSVTLQNRTPLLRIINSFGDIQNQN